MSYASVRSVETVLRCCAVCAAMVVVGTAHAQTWSLDELVDKNVQARGGMDAVRAMKSLRLVGKLLVNNGQYEMGYVQTFARSSMVRTEVTLQGLTQTQAFDGTVGWQINPFQGRKDPERLSSDDSKGMAEAASEFDGPLIDWKAKGLSLVYLGTEDVDGTLAHKIKLTRSSGDVEYVWLDPELFLEIRTLSQRVENGVQQAIETDFGDYEKVSGVMIPFAIDTGNRGSTDKQKFVIEKAQVNAPTDPAMFAFPPSKAKAIPSDPPPASVGSSVKAVR